MVFLARQISNIAFFGNRNFTQNPIAKGAWRLISSSAKFDDGSEQHNANSTQSWKCMQKQELTEKVNIDKSQMPRYVSPSERRWMVSNMGRFKDTFGRVTRGTKTNGYSIIKVYGQHFRTHQIVLRTFIGQPPNEKQKYAIHKNNDKWDNALSNLEYASISQLQLRSYRQNAKRARNTGRPVEALKDGESDWQCFVSQREASAITGASRSSIGLRCRENLSQNQKSIHGYKFRYKKYDLLPNEEWREVAVGNWMIEVSSMGRYKNSTGRIGYGSIGSDGYYRMGVGGWNTAVHRIICDAFNRAPESPMQMEVTHKDGDVLNNKADNLVWVTPKVNRKNMHRKNPQIAEKVAISNAKPIYGKLQDKETQQQWYESISEAARVLNLYPQSVHAVLTGRLKQTRGYVFVLTEEAEPPNLEGEIWKPVILPERLQ